MVSPSDSPTTNDPVAIRRDWIDRINKRASRAGYGLYALSTAAFFAGLWTEQTAALHFVSGAALVAGSVILAPSIVVTYGIRAARRDDALAANSGRADGTALNDPKASNDA